MGWPVVIVDSGGIPVTPSLNGLGAPISIAENGFGAAVTLVSQGGIPVLAASAIRADSALITADSIKILADYAR